MATIKMFISKVKIVFYPPCEIKCGLQNGVSTTVYIIQNMWLQGKTSKSMMKPNSKHG